MFILPVVYAYLVICKCHLNESLTSYLCPSWQVLCVVDVIHLITFGVCLVMVQKISGWVTDSGRTGQIHQWMVIWGGRLGDVVIWRCGHLLVHSHLT